MLLFRAGTAIATYEAALADRGLATLATAGGGFFARAEIVDLVAYVRALANPHDEPALYGVLASPLCGCSSDTLVALALRSRTLGVAVWEVLLAEPPDARGRRLRRALRGRAARRRRSAAWARSSPPPSRTTATTSISARCTRPSGGWPTSTSSNAWRAISRRARGATCGVSRRRSRRAASARCARPRRRRPLTGTGAIALMTIHSAKGLEFPVVCLADLGHQGADSHPPALLVDGSRVGLRLPTIERKTLDTLAHAELNAARRAAASAEEERIIYVAMTRARERLILSGAARFASWPSEGRTAISWLGPALAARPPRARRGGRWDLRSRRRRRRAALADPLHTGARRRAAVARWRGRGRGGAGVAGESGGRGGSRRLALRRRRGWRRRLRRRSPTARSPSTSAAPTATTCNGSSAWRTSSCRAPAARTRRPAGRPCTRCSSGSTSRRPALPAEREVAEAAAAAGAAACGR